MVQIILSYINYFLVFLLLLYIPHGSDNTQWLRQRKGKELDLYIPHGSDNTVKDIAELYKTDDFISHMVQIIL